MWLDDELERYWRAPSDAPVLRKGLVARPSWQRPSLDDREDQVKYGPASEASKAKRTMHAASTDRAAVGTHSTALAGGARARSMRSPRDGDAMGKA